MLTFVKLCYNNFVMNCVYIIIFYNYLLNLRLIYLSFRMVNYKTAFANSWLHMQEFQSWLQRSKASVYEAYCKQCLCTIQLGKMGITALKTHANTRKHQISSQAVQHQPNIAQEELFILVPSRVDICPSSGASSSDGPSTGSGDPCSGSSEPSSSSSSGVSLSSAFKSPTVTSYLQKQESGKTEIMWCLHAIRYNLSLRALSSAVDVCKFSFPAEPIAQGMSLSHQKAKYSIIHGIAPHFNKLLIDEVKQSDMYSVSYDEALNKVSQKGQMDIQVRYLKGHEVQTRYLTSCFLGHARASDLVQAFSTGVAELDEEKIIQVCWCSIYILKKWFNATVFIS